MVSTRSKRGTQFASLDGKDAESISEQKKVNKQTLGHEGSASV